MCRTVQGLKAVDESGPKVLGAMMLCGRNYAVFDADSTPLQIDVPAEGTVTIEIDLTALKVSKK